MKADFCDGIDGNYACTVPSEGAEEGGGDAARRRMMMMQKAY